jgi:diguanylate cyclase (GGDEF)-like protein
MRILLVEDDELFAQTLIAKLTTQHYAIDLATDGREGWNYAQGAEYDLIVLDVNLPQIDGISLCRQLRQHSYSGPVLLLTAESASAKKVCGLDAGADDYVVKPCSLDELSARIRALLRRRDSSGTPLLEWGELCLNPSTCEVTYRKQPLSLSSKEYSLLELFLRNPQRVFSSGVILDHIWAFEDAPGDDAVRAHLKRLRRKLKSVGVEDVIATIYGIGYRLNPPPSAASQPVSEQQLAANRARLAAIEAWKHFKAPTLARLAVLDRAVNALQSGALPDSLKAEAEQAAHKLAGSLNMFGFERGTQLARKIEHWLQHSETRTRHVAFRAMVVSLHRELQQSPRPAASVNQPAFQRDGAANLPHLFDSSNAANAVNASKSTAIEEINILVVDDDPVVLNSLKRCFPSWGIQLTTLSDPLQSLEMLETIAPDLLILDVEMPHMKGIELCRAIRQNRMWSGLPILFLTSHRDPETIHRIYTAGADDYVAKPFTEPELLTRILNRLERNRLLRNVADLDTLTGLTNRRQTLRDLQRYLGLAHRHSQPLSIAVVAVDGLEPLGDRPSQPADSLLRQVADLLQQTFHSEDIVSRWGDNEFLLGVYAATASEMAASLRQVMQRIQPLHDTDKPTVPVILSAGVATAAHTENVSDLCLAAETALYQARAAGGDRVIVRNE